jgi:hypothetical protein
LLNPVISRKQVIRDTSDRLCGAGGHHALRSSSDGAAPAPQLNSRCGADKPGGLLNKCSAVETAWEWNCWGPTRSKRALLSHGAGHAAVALGIFMRRPSHGLRGSEIQKQDAVRHQAAHHGTPCYDRMSDVVFRAATTPRACHAGEWVDRTPIHFTVLARPLRYG